MSTNRFVIDFFIFLDFFFSSFAFVELIQCQQLKVPVGTAFSKSKSENNFIADRLEIFIILLSIL